MLIYRADHYWGFRSYLKSSWVGNNLLICIYFLDQLLPLCYEYLSVVLLEKYATWEKTKRQNNSRRLCDGATQVRRHSLILTVHSPIPCNVEPWEIFQFQEGNEQLLDHQPVKRVYSKSNFSRPGTTKKDRHRMGLILTKHDGSHKIKDETCYRSLQRNYVRLWEAVYNCTLK